ncbi:MAG: MATE family efflux transporter [Burkholderiaceae bacterium]
MNFTIAPAIRRQFVELAIPTILSGWIYTIYTLVDGIFIGRYIGEQALAALNLIVPLMYLPYAVSLMVGVGAATLMAKLVGAGQVEAARRVMTQALWGLCAVSASMSALVLTNLEAVLALTGAEGELAKLAGEYLRGYAGFILFANALYALELFLRVEGAAAARFGMWAMLAGGILNIGLDYWWIVIEDAGMGAAALTSGVSLMVSSLAMLAYLLWRTRTIRPIAKAWVGTLYLGRVAYNGASEFLAAVAPAVTVLAFNHAVLTNFGASGLAAYAVLEYMTLAATVTMVGLVQSMQPMISFYRGAQRWDAMRQTFVLGAAAVLAFSAAVAGLMVLGSAQLTQLFLPASDQAATLIAQAVPWYALAFLPAAINLAVAGGLTAIEQAGPSALIAVLRSWLLLLGFLWLLDRLAGGSAIWFALLLTEAVTLAISLALLQKHPLHRTAATR